MRIAADENIPFAREAFSPAGEVSLVSGRSITRETIANSDALIVRSVTRVDAALVAGTRVRFVGSATAGTDHLDIDGLARAGVATATAAGSNAESVSQHVAAVLSHFHLSMGAELAGRTLGIAGVGHCGSRVERVARAFGMKPVLCDPPLARTTGDAKYRPPSELAGCDFVTLHVPLTREDADATAGMIGADFFRQAKPGMILIQASRGGVVDEPALRDALASGVIRAAALDVWGKEPRFSPQTLTAVQIATPHIAGYSLDGKALGTEMMHGALCEAAGIAPLWRASDHLPRLAQPAVARLDSRGPLAAAAEVVLQCHPLMNDDAAMRRLAGLPDAERGVRFDALRRNHPERREFAAWPVRIEGGDAPTRALLEAILRGLGFRDISPA